MKNSTKIELEGQLVEGSFINRLNRFVAEVSIDNEIHLAHVPNTGRMKELLNKGAKVILRKVDNLKRKTKYDLLMVYHNDILVSIDSSMPNKILYKALSEGKLPMFEDFIEVNREVKYKNSRFDLALKGDFNTLIEAKCVTYVEDGVAKFPDAPTSRGRKHVLELIEAAGEGFRAAIIFVIQRMDAEIFKPNKIMDLEFTKALELAYNHDVQIIAIKCKIYRNNIVLWKEVEVKL